MCALLGCKRQLYLSYAKRILGRAHKELQDNFFLGKVEWHPCSTDQSDWVLQYLPGERAIREWDVEYFNISDVADPVFTEKIPQTNSCPVWMEQVESDESSSTTKVVSRKSNQNHKSRKTNTEKSKSKNEDLSSLELDSLELRKLSESSIISALENITGLKRRTPRLSEAEKALLKTWNEAGLTIEVVIEGIRRVLDLELDMAKKSGKKARSIWSLDYCAWAVWDVFSSKSFVSKTVADQPDTDSKEIGVNKKENHDYCQHMAGWSMICVQLKEWLAPKNYTQITQEVLASRFEDKTLHLVVSDPFWRDRIFSAYEAHFLEASGADILEIEVNRGSV